MLPKNRLQVEVTAGRTGGNETTNERPRPRPTWIARIASGVGVSQGEWDEWAEGLNRTWPVLAHEHGLDDDESPDDRDERARDYLQHIAHTIRVAERMEDAALLSAPIEDFEQVRAMYFDYIADGTYRWSEARAVLGIPWPTQIRLLFHGQAHESVLWNWDEHDQDMFEQDVRAGAGYRKLADQYGLTGREARKLASVFRLTAPLL